MAVVFLIPTVMWLPTVADAADKFRHKGKYPPFRVTWRANQHLREVSAVYPHTFLPNMAVVATRSGLFITADSGKTWKEMPGASRNSVGIVKNITFAPDDPRTFYLASDSKGVWVTRDDGGTFRAIGSTANGLLCDRTVGVYFHPFDLRFKTILVAHGEHTPGVSRSDDGGETWSAILKDFHVHHLLLDAADTSFFMSASKKKTPNLRSIYSSKTLGDYWTEVINDVIPTDGAAYRSNRNSVYWTTIDSGTYVVEHGESSLKNVGPEDTGNLTSIGVTYGPTVDTEIVFAYSPEHLGMIYSEDHMETVSSEKQGLFTGPYVKEGAHIRANANGTMFYAVVNDALYRGFVGQGATSIRDVSVSPSVFSFAVSTYSTSITLVYSGMRAFANSPNAAAVAKGLVDNIRMADTSFSRDSVTVKAHIVSRDGTAPAQVTVDLSRVGGSGKTPMYDDGAHGDGEASDGIYGTVFQIAFSATTPTSNDWRRPFPGVMGLTITAVSEKGRLSGAVAPLCLLKRPEGFSWWDEGAGDQLLNAEGAVSAEIEKDPALIKTGRISLKLSVGPGPWAAPWGSLYNYANTTGQYALSFWIKSDTAGNEEFYVQLRDGPIDIFPTTTLRIGVVREGLVEGGAIAGEYRRVVIPLERMLKGAGDFHPESFAFVVFSGETRSGRTYWIDDIRFHLNKENIKGP